LRWVYWNGDDNTIILLRCNINPFARQNQDFLMTQRPTSPAPEKPAPITSLEALFPLLKRGDRLLGLDLGTKTIGLALSDIEQRFASAMKTLARKKFRDDAEALLSITREHKVVAFVLGMPLNMDGSSGPRAQSTRAFARNLSALTDLPILFWDERLSTVAAERTLIEADMSRNKRTAVIDAAAAAFILQGALDRLRALAHTPYDD
jgi:putative holliday junction resolvase